MKITPRSALYSALLATCTICSNAASAASVSYYLDQSNVESVLPDGVNYLTVTIDDEGGSGTNGTLINFTVDIIGGSWEPGTGTYGIRDFAFNISQAGLTLDASNFLLPTSWSPNIPNNADGFGRFDVVLQDGGNSLAPLQFSIDAAGDSINSYFAPSEPTDGMGQEVAWFAAHVNGFVIDGSDITSGWFAGGAGSRPPNEVPVPAAIWLFGSGLIGLAGMARRKKS